MGVSFHWMDWTDVAILGNFLCKLIRVTVVIFWLNLPSKVSPIVQSSIPVQYSSPVNGPPKMGYLHSVDWSAGLECWNGVLEWNCWNGEGPVTTWKSFH